MCFATLFIKKMREVKNKIKKKERKESKTLQGKSLTEKPAR